MICTEKMWAVAYPLRVGGWAISASTVSWWRRSAIKEYDRIHGKGEYKRRQRKGKAKVVGVTMTFEVPDAT